ncbi:MAG: aminoacyl-tRNA hydrolase [bacterium]|nr:MAG: aminoacyl-tRNA hydrolase [bacterium]
MIKLIVALGNPEHKYAATRHNIAWQMLEHLSFCHNLSWQAKFKGEYATYSIGGEKFFLLKPQTYMNNSGESVRPFAHFFKIKFDEILVIHDDIELKFGVVGFKTGGGLAGHNGLRSLVNSLGTRDFKRMRLGISRPTHGTVEVYVLSNFSDSEKTVLPVYLNKAAQLLERCLIENFDFVEKKYKKEMLLS